MPGFLAAPLKNKNTAADRSGVCAGAQLVHLRCRGRVVVSHGGLSFLRPGAEPGDLGLCLGRCSFLAPALEVFTESPLGELCAVPLALVPVQRAGRTTLELLVDRGVVDGEAGRDVSRPVSDQVPRLDLLPVLEGQVAVLSRRSHLRLIWSIKKKKCTADSVGVSVHLILADTVFIQHLLSSRYSSTHKCS